MPFATVSGTTLHYLDTGSGDPPLVLLHAFPLNAGMWDEQITALGPRWRVLAPDLPGFGRSPLDDTAQASIDGWADLVAQLVRQLGLGPVVVGGLSMGGYVGFALVRNSPELLAGLVLADTRAGADSPEQRAGREELAQLVEREGSAAAVERLIPRYVAPSTAADRPEVMASIRAMIAGTPATGLAAAARALASRPDSTATLGQITVPTAVIVGAEDALTPPAEAERLHAAIPGSTLTVIPDAGHLSSLEQPAAFNAAVRALIRRV